MRHFIAQGNELVLFADKMSGKSSALCKTNDLDRSTEEVHDRDPGRLHPSGRTRPEHGEILTRVSACRRIRAFLASRVLGVSFLPRVQLSKYRGAALYGSVPINHLAHGPTIRLLERGSYYPARVW